jgi:hypothetical protein
MSALGHKQTSRHVRVMSVIPLKADIHQRGCTPALCQEPTFVGGFPLPLLSIIHSDVPSELATERIYFLLDIVHFG